MDAAHVRARRRPSPERRRRHATGENHGVLRHALRPRARDESSDDDAGERADGGGAARHAAQDLGGVPHGVVRRRGARVPARGGEAAGGGGGRGILNRTIVITDADGNEVEGAVSGNLCIKHPWPGQMRTVFGDHQRFKETYFSTYPGYYFTGDGCRRDEDGYYWITGRVDDVLNVSGHRMGTAEIESALVLHESVAEAAVVGFPHEIKGQGIYTYVTLNSGVEESEDLKKELVQQVRKEIGPIATIDVLQWAPGLPKTRSGKIMRRILRKIAENDIEHVGDTSTLADPSVVDDLIQNRPSQ